MRVLVIGQNRQIVKKITSCLKVRYPEATVASVADGLSGMPILEKEPPDMVMVGSLLPNTEVYDLVSRIRELSDVPLIVVCKGEVSEEGAKALEAGADEYVTEAFAPMDLLAKVRALLRRTQKLGFETAGLVAVGDEIIINRDMRRVFVSGKQVELTPGEYELLTELVANEGKVCTYGMLLETLQGSEHRTGSDLIRKYIYRLRSKLEPGATGPGMLLNERGVGYRFIRPGRR